MPFCSLLSNGGKYQRKQVSIKYRQYRNQHRYSDILLKIHITNFTSTSQSRISTFGLQIFQVSLTFAPFLGYFHFRFFFFGIFGYYSSENTKYRYLNNISILNDTKRYRYYFAPLLLRVSKNLPELWDQQCPTFSSNNCTVFYSVLCSGKLHS